MKYLLVLALLGCGDSSVDPVDAGPIFDAGPPCLARGGQHEECTTEILPNGAMIETCKTFHDCVDCIIFETGERCPDEDCFPGDLMQCEGR